ncbi:MAG: metallophosphoesterase [Actinomycetota bacterium]
MCQTSLTRRQLLRQAALLAATAPVVASISPFRSLAEALELQRGAGTGAAVPMHVELVTVTDTQAIITWFTGDPTDLDEFGRPRPVSAPGRVLIGVDPDPRTWREVGVHGPTPFHYVVVDGLEPGTSYYWRAESAGLIAHPTVINRANPLDLVAPSPFATLVPPPGRELGRVAWFNDLHFGEKVAGLAYSNDMLPRGGLPPGFPVDTADPYWRFMGRNAVVQARDLGCTLLLANGDLTSEAEPAELAECRDTLDAFGAIGGRVDGQANPASPGRVDLGPGDEPAYFVTRGNHDRWHRGDVYADCTAGEGDLRDCFSDAFTPSWEPGSTHFSVTIGDDRARFRFVGLDSNDGEDTGVLRPGELDYLEQELARGDLTIPLFHHPASDIAGLSDPIPGGSSLRQDHAQAFREVVARHQNVAGVYAGHTHRNNRSLATGTGDVPFFEGGAV